MDDTRNVTKDGQNNVDEEVGIAASLEEHSERWEDDGEDDLDDVAVRILSALLCYDVAAAFRKGKQRRNGENRAEYSRSGERHVGGVLLVLLIEAMRGMRCGLGRRF